MADLVEILGAALAARLAEARAAWPGVELAEADFVRYLAARLEPPVETALAKTSVSDLYLACACVAGLAPAIAAFDRAMTPVIDRAVTATGASPTEAADLRQVVRQRLLVAPATATGAAAEPRIATYTGRGELGSWVRVIATREAQRLLPRERREVHADDDSIDRMIAPETDPELGYLKRLYRAEFRAAFAAAIDALSARERMLLQQHALDGLGIDKLAAFHKVHRATAARWIEAAREAVLTGTRKELIRRLEIGRDELDSIMRLIASQLDVSLPRLLQRP